MGALESGVQEAYEDITEVPENSENVHNTSLKSEVGVRRKWGQYKGIWKAIDSDADSDSEGMQDLVGSSSEDGDGDIDVGSEDSSDDADVVNVDSFQVGRLLQPCFFRNEGNMVFELIDDIPNVPEPVQDEGRDKRRHRIKFLTSYSRNQCFESCCYEGTDGHGRTGTDIDGDGQK